MAKKNRLKLAENHKLIFDFVTRLIERDFPQLQISAVGWSCDSCDFDLAYEIEGEDYSGEDYSLEIRPGKWKDEVKAYIVLNPGEAVLPRRILDYGWCRYDEKGDNLPSNIADACKRMFWSGPL